ncbi:MULTISPECIES: SDR family NAD(P)-dependent oxidoreductase [Sphingobium]|jgi:NAD(P)-dependent dehydrogenase (short-subunit alcohol dehydrogenase family)|uniref:SDR family oxidoreductase n=1 Tax=Sphingobium yanoikuyae TaxID=13690 RepID=A0A6M4G754_SPHYA|nr:MULTISPECIES: SDR family NAD(P)-dependent oxidoreductase [Sphingobium]MBS49004.1 3-hydroxyacyl-CoA dehydrogenase [Sphingobium sp.]MEE2741375.1 SDR family NAD(P)-dependent oxidoreductase [Pseudomonadota bacterium]MCC4256327.1 SDR family oxidoreductase [Sphingobium lactosutens]QJR02384.1 SDR family oxidoreductase [Sphingobium yanoikuyae]HCW61969.1 3-hydroxyacyl-CoA dehydrogenase [Sphingobium sp.]|tara:strand:+ start:21384 stop:22304 length:921 start_codon:yes stop_codon:yes gene_type:complete
MGDSARLDGKVVAVTGAGRGIGRDIALLCARQGANVVVNDLGASAEGEGADAGPAEEVAALIRAEGGKAIVNGASVAEPEGAASIIEDAVKQFGRIDGVVNNAGILRDRIFHKMSIVDWKQVIDVHLNGSFYVSKAAAPYFKDQGSGSYVHFTSTSGLIGNFGQANYSAAKMGIFALSNSIALDMQRFGVRSNCIAPFAWSRLIATIPATNPDEEKRIERMKTMTTDKIAPMVAALLSDGARDVSGQTFGVRKNEIFLFNKPRPIKTMQRSGGWTPDTIVSDLLPAMAHDMMPLARSAEIWPYDPV